ncbi:hypothetical protein Lal_00005187, partial [Lupinus albus]
GAGPRAAVELVRHPALARHGVPRGLLEPFLPSHGCPKVRPGLPGQLIGEGRDTRDAGLHHPPPVADHPHPVRDHGDQFPDRADRPRRPDRADDRPRPGDGGGGDLAHRRQRRRRRQRRPAPEPDRRRQRRQVSRRPGAGSRLHQAAGEGVRLRQAAARTLHPHDVELHRLRFRHQLLPRPPRRRSGAGKDAGVDLARHLDDADRLSGLHPLGHRQGGARRPALRCLDLRSGHRRLRHPQLPVRGAADRGVRRRPLSRLVPPARSGLGQLGQPALVQTGARLFLAHGAAGAVDGDRRFRRPDHADQELLHGRDRQAVRHHRAGQGPDGEPRAVRPCLPQRDADRHRRLPRRLHRHPVHRRHADRGDLLARRAGTARLRGGDQPRLSGDVRHALFLHAAGADHESGEPPRLLVLLDLPGAVHRLAGGGVHRQRQAAADRIREPLLLAGLPHLPRDHLRRRVRDGDRLPRPLRPRPDQRQGLDGLAADPLQLPHHQLQPAGPGSRPAVRRQLARHRRPGARRGGAADLRLPHLGAVRSGADRLLVGHRRGGRRGPGLFRRADRPLVPALHRDLAGAAHPVPADHPGQRGDADLLVVARPAAAVLLDRAGPCGAGGVPAGAQPRLRARGQGAGGRRRDHHGAPCAAQRHGGDADLHALHPQRLDHHPDRAGLPRLRSAARLALAGRVAGPGQGQPPGAVARPDRLLRAGDHAESADLHRRGGARRLRPAQDHRPDPDAPQPRPAVRAGPARRFPLGRRRDPGRQGRVLRHPEGRDAGAGRRIGLRQVGHGSVDPATAALPDGAPPRRLDPLPRHRTAGCRRAHPAAGARQPHRHDLPGADDLAEPAAQHRAADQRDPVPAQAPVVRRRPCPHTGAAAPRRPARPGKTADRLPARAVGRPAPARDDRHGARQRARPADRRRADHGARRHHPGADPGAAEGSAKPLRHGAAADHPRSRRGAQDGGPRLRDEPGRDRRAGEGRRPVHPPAPRLHEEAPVSRAARQPAVAARGCGGGDGRRPAEGPFPDQEGPAAPHRRPHQGGGRRRCRGAPRPHGRRRRRIGIGQDHAWPGPAAPARQRGRHPLRRHRHPGLAAETPARPATRDADRLPGPLWQPVAPPVGRPDHRRGAGHPRHRRRQGTRGDGRPRPGGGRPAARRAQPLPARVLRRPAPAHRHRPRPGAEAEIRRAGRADLGARHVGAGADRRSAARHPGPPQPRLPVHQPRSAGGAGAVQPRHGDEGRQGGRTGTDPAHLRGAARGVHPRPARRRAEPGGRRVAGGADVSGPRQHSFVKGRSAAKFKKIREIRV